MFNTRKTTAAALNEVTVTIQSTTQRTNYHESFLVDLTVDNSFEFKGKKYFMPAQDAMHYHPDSWRFDLKLAMFFEHHKFWAKLFDWFHIKEKAVYEVGFLYDEGTPEPYNLVSPPVDWALENFNLQRNTSISATHKDADNKLRGKQDHFNALLMFGVMIVAIVGIVLLALFLSGGLTPAPVHEVANVTAPFNTPLTSQVPNLTPFRVG